MSCEDESGKRAARCCPACGAEFTCDIAAGRSRCWCFDLPPLEAERLTDAGCLCPGCLRKRLAGGG